MALIVSGPIQWIELANIGLSFRLVHIPFFALALIGFLDLARNRIPKSVVRKVYPFSILYIIYTLGLLAPSIMGSFNVSSLIKITTYALSAFGIYLACAKINTSELISALKWASLLAVLSFIAVATITLATRGISLLDTVLVALATGDAKALQFRIFLNLFNETTIRTENTVNVSLRNTLIGFFILTFAFSMNAATSGKGGRLSYFAAIGSALVILISVSRSNVIVLLLVCALGFIALAGKNAGKSALAASIVCSALAILPLFLDFGGVSQILADRVGSFGDDGRIDMYSIALSEIDNSAYFGHGAGYTIELRGKELTVHNLFLAAWLQGGLVSLAGAIGFIGSIAIFLANHAKAYWKDPQSLFILGILILPLFRSQISGDGGNFTLPEWSAIAICGAYFYNKDTLREASRVFDSRPHGGERNLSTVI